MFLLRILGFLLKAVGILLLAVLGLLLLLMLILLFVPVRYRARITRHGEELIVKAQVSWLGSMLRVPVTYQEGKLDYRAKLLCFTVFPRKKKKKVQEGQPEEIKAAEEMPSETVQESQSVQIEQTEKESNMLELQGEVEQTPVTHQKEAQITQDMQLSKEDAVKESEEPLGPIGRLLRKLQKMLDKIKALYQKAVDWIIGTKARITQKLSKIKEKVNGLRTRISEVYAFLQAEDTRLALKLTGKSIFQLIKYILPYKIKGEVIFGTGDPYSMGQVLSVLGIFYGVYARTLQIEADFETTEFRLDGRVELKGRIRFGRVLYILLRLWFKGKLRQVIANAKGLIPG